MNNSAQMSNYPIQWSEGMLLSPHHFQQSDIYWAQQIQSRTALIQPYYWGIDEIRIDENRLVEGTLTISKLRVIFRDGLLVDYDAEHDEEPLKLELGEHMNAETRILRVFVNVPVRTEGAASQKNTRRYSSLDGGMVADENTGLELVPISRLKPVLSLSAERLHENYVSQPLLEIEFSLDGAYRISTSYVPPLLKIAAFREMKGFCIQSRLAKLLLKLRRKANQLAGITADKEDDHGSAISEQHAHIIRHLVSALPQLEVLCFSGTAHPFQVYEQLAALNGQLCNIGRLTVPPQLPRYQHEDMAAGFLQALKFAEAIVNGVSLAYNSLLFSEDAPGSFSIDIEQSWLSRRLLIELVFSSSQPEEQRLAWLQNARLGSESVMKTLSDRRMPGATLQRITRDEELGVSARQDSLLLTVKNSRLDTGTDTVLVISAGQKLCLKGPAGKSAPRRVALHIANEAERDSGEN